LNRTGEEHNKDTKNETKQKQRNKGTATVIETTVFFLFWVPRGDFRKYHSHNIFFVGLKKEQQ